ncbi:methionine aminopeptidase, type I [Desulfobulbus propionicus DSM 2032]|uniref:Methionine aminopeptidase n=1 Tax=Desulfobulbus propionicus (strain ATCC 33891 / DSM 2032 / VKM B-1956 / 1pr3) TaxID=577650 RepID=A0A7U3YKC6_DESPD|nr:type I methionyl aminopeptidase [Desulfobulbus propionicus]ADW16982.1 methionine aminopeptidase, type I [Desulfobulbus propionicus DSM 2032]
MTKSYTENAIIIKNSDEIAIMHKANQIVAGVLSLLESNITEGITTFELDKLAEEYCYDHHAKPAFKGYKGFPASLCASVNEEVVHGIPSKKKLLRSGDIVSLDFGVLYQGFYGDSAITVTVGNVSPTVERLLEVTRNALLRGIEQARVGNRVSDISRAVQNYAESYGFSVVRQFVGHGIGANLHEPPEIPNYVQRQASPRLVEGMVLAIEPMINMGGEKVKVLNDQWTVVTADRKPSAHFEHSVAVLSSGPLVLSERLPHIAY